MRTPGEHVIVIGTEADALRARAQGLTLRDTVTILLPGPRTLTGYLFRAPLTGTVADNVLRHGSGGLNVDGCRVGYQGKSLEEVRREARSPGKHSSNCQMDYAGGWGPRGDTIEFHPGGRWPTNLVLVHGLGCHRHVAKSGEASWTCQADCPVCHLDRCRSDDLVAGATSRVFPQFTSLPEAVAWLRRLVGSPDPVTGLETMD